MKTIIECDNGTIYVYREREKQYKKNRKFRGRLPIKTQKDMDEECNTATWGNNWVVVVGGSALEQQ